MIFALIENGFLSLISSAIPASTVVVLAGIAELMRLRKPFSMRAKIMMQLFRY